MDNLGKYLERLWEGNFSEKTIQVSKRVDFTLHVKEIPSVLSTAML